MQNQEESLLYGLRLLIRVLGVLLLFNIVNGVGTVVNEYKNSRHPNVEVQVDTCIIHDTIFVEKPILQKVAVTDTLRLPVLTRDTLMLHDTVLVTLPIEQRQYGDPRYTAWVSGYRPQLDAILTGAKKVLDNKEFTFFFTLYAYLYFVNFRELLTKYRLG